YCYTPTVYSLTLSRQPRSPLFPYTTLFRSADGPNRPEPSCSPNGRRHLPWRTHGRWEGRQNAMHPATVAIAMSGQRTASRSIRQDRKSTRLNSSHVKISYAVFCLKKKKKRE